jgi:hypothetical protein
MMPENLSDFFFSKLYLWSLLVSCLVSCSARDPEMETYHRFLNTCSKQISKEYRLHCYGAGGSVPDKVCIVELFFESNQQMNIQQARRLIIPIAEKMIDDLNADEKLRPYLKDYPATYKNIGAVIAFKVIHPDERDSECIKSVFIGQINTILYVKKDAVTGYLYDVHEEFLEEGKRILAEEDAYLN